MRKLATWVAAVAVLALMAGSAAAQEQKGRRGQRGGFGRGGMFGFGGGGVALLSNPGVQQELKMTDEQKEKVTAFAEKRRERMGDLRGGGGADPEKMQAMFRELAKEGDKFAKDTLKAEQYKRYKQISFQQAGVMGFADEEVQKELKVTDEQKEKLRTLAADFTRDQREIFQNSQGNFQEAREKTQALTKETMTKIEAVLTAEQKATLKELKGAPFEVQFQRGRRGGDR
jgi:Spy/CpxP family protein refolding chaperone